MTSLTAPDAIVIIHGFYANAFVWESVAHQLAERTHQRVVVFDRIGFGLSSRPERKGKEGRGGSAGNLYSPEGQAKATIAMLRKLGLRRVSLAVHDDGAKIALVLVDLASRAAGSPGSPGSPGSTGSAGDAVVIDRLALLHPNVVADPASKLMEQLMSSNIKGSTRKGLLRMEVEVTVKRQCYGPQCLDARQMHWYKMPLYVRGWEQALKGLIEASKWNADVGMGVRMGVGVRVGVGVGVGVGGMGSPPRTGEVGGGTYGAYGAYGAGGSAVKAAKGGGGGGRFPMHDKLARLERVLVLTGLHDAVSRVEEIEALREHLPGSVAHVLDHCGHLSHHECPDALLAKIVPFFLPHPSAEA